MRFNEPQKVTISGWYGHFNAGDDAILQVFIEQMTNRLGCNIAVLSEEPQNIQKTNSVRGIFHLFPSFTGTVPSLLNGDFCRHLRQLRNSEMFVLGGGGILRDNTNWRNLIRVLDEIWLSKIVRRKAALYAIGVGPFRSPLGKRLIGLTVKMCDLITVRDEKSAALLREIGIPAEKIHVVADPAFLLEPTIPRDQSLLKILAGGRKVGVFPTSNTVYGRPGASHIRQLANALDTFFGKTRLEFVALPMQVSEASMDDVKFSFEVKRSMKYPHALHVYESRLTPAELKWTTGQTLFNITMRLHAMIFSLGMRVPVVPINYEPKVANVFVTIGCPEYLVEVDNNFESNLISAAEKCLENLPQYSRTISAAMIDNEKMAARTFELLTSLFNSKNSLKQLPNPH